MALMGMIGAYAQNPYEQGNPNDPEHYAYLNDYLPLKEYIDYNKYPNFKLGVGTTVDNYLKKGTVYDMTNSNFTETVAGNAMKMSSCVNNNGDMNFTTVKNYVNEATAAGLNVYGHTLAWHAQQPGAWLRSLMKDRPGDPIEDPDVIDYVSFVSKDFRTLQNVGWHSDEAQYGYTLTFSSTDGLKVHTTYKTPNSWDVQFLAVTDMALEKGADYRMTMTVKGSSAGNLHSKLGDWGEGRTANVPFTTEWQDVVINYNNSTAGSFYMLQCGDFVGDIYIKKIVFEKAEPGKYITEDRRCVVVNATEMVDAAWDNQFWIVADQNFSKGATYEFSADVRADKDARASTQLHSSPGTYVYWQAVGDVEFTTNWKTIHASGTLAESGKSIAFNLNEFTGANTYYFDNLSFKVNGVEQLHNGDCEGTDVSSFYKKENRGAAVPATISDEITYIIHSIPVPLTEEEVHDTLVYAMDKWIHGMMDACQGKVKAWDVVNEAISGGGNNGEGFYTLQHGDGSNSNFYWQDYMGDLEYVRQAIRLARLYGPEDIKLFINDYNLESDWDNNKKLKSLINWIGRWEADGTTYVDGIGTQMHISCYMNENTQRNKKNAIENMFRLMANTGKLVRVSELDMGMVDASGKDVPTGQMTEEMHHRMADLYKWIIEKYLEIIPVEQQWGICQWCPTDSPSNSGWRANTPVGIWDINYYRKHVYAGYAEGLGAEPSGINEIVTDVTNQDVYTINGVRVKHNTTSLDDLKPGLYIVGGKKVIKN